MILNQMRKMGMNQPFLASDRSVSPEFAKIAGVNAEGVICGYPWNPDHKDPKLEAFRAAFRKRFNAEPDTYAAHAYDGMNMLIWATQVAGLNRAKIRDVLAYRTKPWPGVTHDIPFGAALDDLGAVFLARFENGAWRYHSREDMNIPRGYIPARDRVNRTTGEIDPMSPAPQK
jgi:branched-chain amino acid transport system substrate-binding protein